jgi:hypothetical protein
MSRMNFFFFIKMKHGNLPISLEKVPLIFLKQNASNDVDPMEF